MKQVAQTAYEELTSQLADDVINGVGYFDDGTQEFIYASDEIKQRYDETVLVDILENAFFDVYGSVNQERIYGSKLHATTRVYDEYVDTVIPLGERKGIVFIIKRDAEYQYPRIVEQIEEVIITDDVGLGLES